MRLLCLSFALAALAACETSTYDETGVEYEPPRPAPELAAPPTSEDAYVLTEEEAALWAENDIGEDNADAALDELEAEILEDN